MWQERRRWPAVLALVGAVLTREVMIALIVALAIEVAARAWRQRSQPAAWRATLREAWPVVIVPTVVFAAWQAYVMIRAGGPIGTSTAMFPFTNMVQEATQAVSTEGGIGVVDIAWVLLMGVGVVLAVRRLFHAVDVVGLAAAALCVSIVIPEFGDFWSDTRLAAPLFAVLLLDGLRRRDRAQVALGAITASLSLLFVLAIL